MLFRNAIFLQSGIFLIKSFHISFFFTTFVAVLHAVRAYVFALRAHLKGK